MTFKLSEKGKKTKIRIEKQKVTCSVALVTTFLGNQNRQLKDLSQADFGRVPKKNKVHQRTLRFLFGDFLVSKGLYVFM